MFENYKDSLFNDKIILRSQQRFRSDHHRMYTEEVNKIAQSSNDDKRIQIFHKVTTYSYGTNVFMVCKNEMMLKNKVVHNRNSRDQLKMDDYSSMLKNHSKILKSDIKTYKDNISLLKNKLNSINSELSDLPYTLNLR